MSKYLVKLYPADTFFFSQARIFGLALEAPYYTRSEYFPQQTALFGMVRHQLLLQNELLKSGQKRITDTENANKLIGNNSFDGKTDSYGVIAQISPVFLMDSENRKYFTAPYTMGLEISENIQIKSYAGREMEVRPYKTYDVKNFEEKLISVEGKALSFSQVYVPQERTGIRKKYAGREGGIEDAYYRQLVYKLKAGYCFAFYLDIDEAKYAKGVNFASRIINFGGERSCFAMKVIPVNDGLPPSIAGFKTDSALALLSDTFVTDTKHIRFAHSETVFFRNIKTSTSKAQYTGTPEFYDSRCLLKKGSVLFTDNMEALKNEIDKPEWTIAGFNRYITKL